jgi:predicted nuclease with TOPRIM domain
METEIFNLIINSGGLALVLAILILLLSLTSFRYNKVERNELRKELKELQDDYHEFKNSVIEKLLESQEKFSETVRFLADKIGALNTR